MRYYTLRRTIALSFTISITAISLVTTPLALAENNSYTMPMFDELCQLHFVFSLGGGAAFSSDLGESKVFPILNPITDERYVYSPSRSNQTAGLFDSFIGAEWTLSPLYALQVGLSYSQTEDFEAKGTFLQGADVVSEDQYTYHYNISTRQLLAEGKLLYSLNKCYFHPYLSFGLGAAFNEASGYKTNVPPFLTFTREYKNNSETSLSYRLGVGVDFDVYEHFRFGLGYRFASLGSANLGRARIDTTNVGGTLKQNNFHANELLAQIIYVY